MSDRRDILLLVVLFIAALRPDIARANITVMQQMFQQNNVNEEYRQKRIKEEKERNRRLREYYDKRSREHKQ